MGYIGQEFHDPLHLVAGIKQMSGGTPSTTIYERGSAEVTNTGSHATKKTWTVASDGACLVAYAIDPDLSSSGVARLRVTKNSSTIAEMTSNGSQTGTNFLVALAYDDNHANNVSCLFFENGDEVDLDAYKVSGTVYVEWLYFEYDLN